MSNGKCGICGEHMPRGEEMFQYHGYSGPCPKPPLPSEPTELEKLQSQLAIAREALEWIASWSGGCPANSEYDKGLKAAHDAFSSKALQFLEKLNAK